MIRNKNLRVIMIFDLKNFLNVMSFIFRVLIYLHFANKVSFSFENNELSSGGNTYIRNL